MGEIFAGRYELLDLIGEGGMGSVWRVHDRRTDEVVAAKVLRQSDAVSLLRFVRETGLRIRHPHIVTPLGWAGEDDRVLFTMPIVDGGSVATLVGDHGPLPAPFVAEILRQVLDALATVHASGIVHRDIKPANILLRTTGFDRPHAYLSDFGIAVDIDGPRLTQTDSVIGTPGYMAPEQRQGDLSPASDLYAVGALALVMLTAARPPVEGAPAAARPDDVPDRLWDLVTVLLATDPQGRPDAATARDRLVVPELAWRHGAAGDVEVLRQIETGGDEPAPRQGEQGAPVTEPRRAIDTDEPRTPTRPARRWALVGAAAAVLLVMGGVLAWSPWAGTKGDPTAPEAASSSTSSTSATSASRSTTETTSPPSSAPTASTTTPGSYDLGVVVSTVGQECSFSDVGLEEETTDGVPVTCRRGDDGDYAWERTEP